MNFRNHIDPSDRNSFFLTTLKMSCFLGDKMGLEGKGKQGMGELFWWLDGTEREKPEEVI